MCCTVILATSCVCGTRSPQAARRIHLSKNEGHSRPASGNDLLPAFQMAGSRSRPEPVLFFRRFLRKPSTPGTDTVQQIPRLAQRSRYPNFKNLGADDMEIGECSLLWVLPETPWVCGQWFLGACARRGQQSGTGISPVSSSITGQAGCLSHFADPPSRARGACSCSSSPREGTPPAPGSTFHSLFQRLLSQAGRFADSV